MMKHKVFVYGTLKTGCSNHHYLENFLGQAAIALHMDLYAGPDYPFAVRGQGQTQGELYEINDIVLQQLDELEISSCYHRELTEVVLSTGETVTAWIYLNPQYAYHYPRIRDGNWQP